MKELLLGGAAKNWKSLLLFLICPLVPQVLGPGVLLVTVQWAHMIAKLGTLVLGVRAFVGLGRFHALVWGSLVLSAAPALLWPHSVLSFDESRAFYASMLTWSIVVAGAVVRMPRTGGALALVLLCTFLPSTRYLADRWQRCAHEIERALDSARDALGPEPNDFPEHLVVLGYCPPPVSREGMKTGLYPVMFCRPHMPRDMKVDVVPRRPLSYLPSPREALGKALRGASADTRYLALVSARNWKFRLVYPQANMGQAGFPVMALSPASEEVLVLDSKSGNSQEFEIEHPSVEQPRYILTMLTASGHCIDVPVTSTQYEPMEAGFVRAKIGPVRFPAETLKGNEHTLAVAWSVTVLGKSKQSLGRSPLRLLVLSDK